jgi:hypothetical protein
MLGVVIRCWRLVIPPKLRLSHGYVNGNRIEKGRDIAPHALEER